ncbi:MAG: NAD(P)/FAD-dependent oxidoreductase [bacterium]
MKYDFDVLIVGAGIPGSLLAKKIAEAGFKAGLLDVREKKEIGHPWEVTVEKEVFGKICLKLPGKNLFEECPLITRFYALNRKEHVQVDSDRESGFCIQHSKLNKVLLKMALSAGVEFLGNHVVCGLRLHGKNIVGVSGVHRNGMFKKSFNKTGMIVVDASGVSAVIRRRVPEDFMIKSRLHKQDYASGWQELRSIDSAQANKLIQNVGLFPGICYTRIGKYHAYQTIHLRKDHKVNLIFGSSLTKGSKSAYTICKDFLSAYPYFGKQLHGGGGLIPIRRSLDNMVGNGFLCLGDCACQVIPTIGSGVASSMHAASIAASTIISALNRGDVSLAGLWSYNYRYQTERGAILASYDIVRRFLQSLSIREINGIFKAGLLRDENFINTFSSNEVRYNINQILENLGKFFSNFRLLPLGVRFIQMARDSQKALNIYKNYPPGFNRDLFLKWQTETNNLFSHYRTFREGFKEKYI